MGFFTTFEKSKKYLDHFQRFRNQITSFRIRVELHGFFATCGKSEKLLVTSEKFRKFIMSPNIILVICEKSEK